MKGKREINYEGLTITFDFDNLTINVPEVIEIDVFEIIKEREEFQFLYKCLKYKNGHDNGYYEDNKWDEERFEKLSAEFEERYGD